MPGLFFISRIVPDRQLGSGRSLLNASRFTIPLSRGLPMYLAAYGGAGLDVLTKGLLP